MDDNKAIDLEELQATEVPGNGAPNWGAVPISGDSLAALGG